MKKIEEGSIDVIISDIPYGTTACKWDSVIPFDLMWEQINRVIKPTGVVCLFGSEPFSSSLRMSNPKNYKYDWYWIKNKPSGSLTAKKQPMKAVENICVFYGAGASYFPIMIDRTEDELKRLSKKQVFTPGTEIDGRVWATSGSREHNKLKYPRNTINIKTVFNRSKEKVKHPTQKPVELMEYLIKTYSNVGETIMDFTIGSGTLGVACVNTDRKFIGFELDKTYFELAELRIQEAICLKQGIPMIKPENSNTSLNESA